MKPRLPLLVVMCLAAGVLFSACGAGDVIDPRKTEIAVRYNVEEATGEKVEKVTCPSDVPVATGNRFTCLVEAVSGDEAVAELEITATNGNLRVLSLEAP